MDAEAMRRRGSVGQHSSGMNAADILATVNEVVAWIGVVAVVIGVLVAAYVGRDAARVGREAAQASRDAAQASREAAEQGRRSVELGHQAIEQARLVVAEARAARREEHLYRDLDRLERMATLLKSMWAIVNRVAEASTLPPVKDLTPAQEMDALLYGIRAVLMMFGREELPECRHLVDSHNGRQLLANGRSLHDPESEVEDAITRCRAALKDLA